MRGTPLRRPDVWWRVGLVGVMAVVVLSLIPEPPSLDIGPSGFGDHILTYGTLMAWFARVDVDRQVRLHVGIALVILGVVLECLQGLTGWRSFDVNDMGANMLGVLIGWAASPPRMPNGLPTAERLLFRTRG